MAGNGKISILIADAHEVVRTGLSHIIACEDDLELVAVAANSREALQKLDVFRPNVVIVDLMKPEQGGLEMLERIGETFREIRVLVLTAAVSADALVRARHAGVACILMKSTSNRKIISSIRAIAAGKTVVSPGLNCILDSVSAVDCLSARQYRILMSVTQGLSNHAIALQLGITIPGVKKQLHTIYNKLGVANRAEATAVVLRNQQIKAWG